MKKRIVNKHHIVYPSPDHPEQEKVVKVFKGEHEILTKINLYTRKEVSVGFLSALSIFVALNSDRAVEIKEN